MTTNPFFPTDKDRWQIWEMLVSRDREAFLRQDWSVVQGDFVQKGFVGIDAGGSFDPVQWQIVFPDLDAYKHEWMRQAEQYKADPRLLQEGMEMDLIEIQGDVALAHKHFSKALRRETGRRVLLGWQTLYQCRREGERWKITGFTGYLPPSREKQSSAILVPGGSVQHRTAGPYSPVLVVTPGQLLVISGQAALDMEGNTVGKDIEEQTTQTLENCRRQLTSAGCGFGDVFKVNVYLRDMGDWHRFNAVYRHWFDDPRPVRAVVGGSLLGDFLVEIEMWAAL